MPEPKAKPMYALGIEADVAHHLRMHLARAGDLEPAALQRPALEHACRSRPRLGEREERRPEAQLRARRVSKNALQEVECSTAFRSAKADVLVDPQAFDLVEHRRVRRVGVDAVGAARRDDAHVGHRRRAGVRLRMRLRVADLHRRGVRAQVQPAALVVLQVDVERVLHRARRMVLRVVERGEVVAVGLDLGAVGDVEADRARRSPRCARARG